VRAVIGALDLTKVTIGRREYTARPSAISIVIASDYDLGRILANSPQIAEDRRMPSGRLVEAGHSGTGFNSFKSGGATDVRKEGFAVIKSTNVLPAWISALPSNRAIARLFIGGFAGLIVWEIWARFVTAAVLGGPLQPAGLVISLVLHWTGYQLPRLAAEAAHYAIGIVGYPLAYFVISRAFRRWTLVFDTGVCAIFTVFAVVALLQQTATPFMGIFWLIVTVVTLTRFVNPNTLIADCLSWGSLTWFNALGIMAPLAGLPFLLMEWGGGLSFMSYIGHIIYGFTAAYVFENGQRRGLE
jgi:hypothetical protein